MEYLFFLFVLIVCVGVGLAFTQSSLTKLSWLERIISTLVIGVTVWSLGLYLTAWLHIRWLSLAGVIMSSLFGWYRYGRLLLLPKLNIQWWLSLIVLAGVVGQLTLVAPSGLAYADGVRFYGVNAHDAMWHVALMETLDEPFPPLTPTYAGVPLKGYHFLIDLFGSELVSLFHFSPFDLTFRLLPLLFSVVTGIAIYLVIKRLTSSKLAQFFGVFLAYFGGSFGYITGGGESTFWAQQSISTFINLPLGASFASIATMIMLFLSWLDSKDKRLLWLVGLLAGSMVGIKAYAGILVLGGFGATVALFILLQKQWWLMGPLLLSGLIAVALVFTNVDIQKSSFIWEPGWFLKTMMEASDRVNNPRWEMLRQTYLYDHNYPRLIQLWGTAFVVFLGGNLGVRVIGIITLLWIARDRKYCWFSFFFGIIGLGGLVLPLLLLQSGIVWNAIQFIYYTLFVMNVFAAILVSHLPKQKWITYPLVALALAAALPTTHTTLVQYTTMYQSNSSVYLVQTDELATLNTLKELPFGTVIAPYSELSFISAFSGKSVYFTDQTQADILQIENSTLRKKQLNELFCGSMKPEEIKALMEQNAIDYIYSGPGDHCQRNDFGSMYFLKHIFSTTTTSLYEYQ